MELLLQRKSAIGIALPGEMTVDGQHACWTLENYPDRIPAGRYKVTLYPSPHFGRFMPLLEDVPGRSDIEIHWGTFPQNYKGCIGVGTTQDLATGEIFQTEAMFLKLFPAIESATEAEGCWITIADALDNSEDVQDAANGEK